MNRARSLVVQQTTALLQLEMPRQETEPRTWLVARPMARLTVLELELKLAQVSMIQILIMKLD